MKKLVSFALAAVSCATIVPMALAAHGRVMMRTDSREMRGERIKVERVSRRTLVNETLGAWARLRHNYHASSKPASSVSSSMSSSTSSAQ